MTMCSFCEVDPRRGCLTTCSYTMIRKLKMHTHYKDRLAHWNFQRRTSRWNNSSAGDEVLTPNWPDRLVVNPSQELAWSSDIL